MGLAGIDFRLTPLSNTLKEAPKGYSNTWNTSVIELKVPDTTNQLHDFMMIASNSNKTGAVLQPIVLSHTTTSYKRVDARLNPDKSIKEAIKQLEKQPNFRDLPTDKSIKIDRALNKPLERASAFKQPNLRWVAISTADRDTVTERTNDNKWFSFIISVGFIIVCFPIQKRLNKT